MSNTKPMLERKTWEEFRGAGLVWFGNRLLHLFGWAICFNIDKDGTVTEVYPAHCSYRGFDEDTENEGFKALTEYMRSDINRIEAGLNA